MFPRSADALPCPQAVLQPTQHDLSALGIRNPARSLAHLGASVALYLGCYMVAASHGGWLKVIAWLVQATVSVGVTSIVHECIHGLFARARWVNRCIGTIAAAIILKNYTLHRAFHLRHHARTTKDDDPEPRAELHCIRDYVVLAARRGNILFTTYVSCSGTWRAVRGFPPHYLPDNQLINVRQDALIELLWFAAVSTGLALRPVMTMFGYVIPLCMSQAISFLIFLPEHYGTTLGSGQAVDNTRTILSNPIFRFLFWNNNFHAEHHAFPGIPYFQLQRIHRLIGAQITHSVSSYTQFHLQLIRHLANKSAQPEGKPRFT
jgi:fatty acid desaturase